MAPGRDPIENGIHDLLNPEPHVLDPARRESLHDQSAQPGMIGRILRQHPVAHRAVDGFVQDLGAMALDGLAHKILAEALVAECPAHVGMASEQAKAKRRSVYRILSA